MEYGMRSTASEREAIIQRIRNGEAIDDVITGTHWKRSQVMRWTQRAGVMLRPRAEVAYIYGLVDPRNGSIFYVGKSRRLATRLANHISKPTSLLVECRMKAIEAAGHKPEIKALEQLGEHDDWRARELAWMRRLADEGHNILNYEIAGWAGYKPQRGRKQNQWKPPQYLIDNGSCTWPPSTDDLQAIYEAANLEKIPARQDE